MSLICHECQSDMQPCEVLPGREGGMLTPVLPSMVWVSGKTGDEKEKWVLAPVVIDYKIALCFACIKVIIQKNRMPFLQALFSAYEAEVEYGRHAEKINGMFLRHDSDEAKKNKHLEESFSNNRKKIPSGCLLCGSGIKNRNRARRHSYSR